MSGIGIGGIEGKREKQVEEYLGKLDQATETTLQDLDALEKCLEPVRMPSVPPPVPLGPDINKKLAEEVVCPLAVRIRFLWKRAVDINDKIRQLKRLEV